MKCPKCLFENPDDSIFCSKCGTELTPSKKPDTSTEDTLKVISFELVIGSTFAGRYQIIEELGRGGMGKVYKVLDNEIGEKVVLKLLKPEIAADEKVIERFRNELKLARKITHKNVCRMFDLNREKELPYITMEYVSGEDLKSTIKRVGSLNADKAIFIAMQICEGLAEAHRLGVIHRDLKSQNIMIDKQGNAHIMDFGIARSPLTDGLTTSGMMVGTPYYISPEQVQGKDADQRSDIYSLGVIFYEMVTGDPPFTGDLPIAVAYKHTTEKPKNPSEVNEQVPEELSRVIMKCLEKDRAERYQSVEELYAELEKIKKGIPTQERISPFQIISRSWELLRKSKLRKFLIPASAIIGAAAVVAIVWFVTPLHKIFKAAPAQAALPAVADYFKAADQYLKDKNFSEAYSQFRKIIDLEPGNIEAQLGLAGVLKEQGKMDEAVAEFEKAAAINGTDPRPYFQLGEIFEKKQDLKRALDYYQKCFNNTPKGADYSAISQKVKELEARWQAAQEQEKKKEQIVARKPERKEQKAKPGAKVVKKPAESPAKLTAGERMRSDVSEMLNQGIALFNKENFDECLKLMENVLKIDPANSNAQFYLNEAKKRKDEKIKEKEISDSLKTAQEALQRGSYQECLELAQRVLILDPKNAQAKEYSELAHMKISTAQINDLIGQYLQALNTNNLLAFYEGNCSLQFYQKIKKDIELVSKLYDNLQAKVSNTNIQFREPAQADVSFSHVISGVSREEKIRQTLFEGIFKWTLEKQGASWKITDIKFPAEREKIDSNKAVS